MLAAAPAAPAVGSGSRHRLLEIGDERFFQVRARRAAVTSSAGASLAEHAPGIHQGHAVAARGFVHEMGRDEDRDALIAREIDQQLPEAVARQRIDAGGRLVEDQDFRLVHDRDRERQALPDAERQRRRMLIEIVGKPEALDQLVRCAPSAVSRGRWNSRACSSRFWRTVSSV